MLKEASLSLRKPTKSSVTRERLALSITCAERSAKFRAEAQDCRIKAELLNRYAESISDGFTIISVNSGTAAVQLAIQRGLANARLRNEMATTPTPLFKDRHHHCLRFATSSWVWVGKAAPLDPVPEPSLCEP